MTTATTSLPAMTTGTGRGKTLTALDASDYKSTMQRLYTWIQQQKSYEQAAQRVRGDAQESQASDGR